MGESATQPSGPSLEQILWRAMDRFQERPALVDAEEFADRIAHAFDADLAEESFADHFFEGAEKLHQPPTANAAVVQAARQRLHVYEFDLARLEYVIVEDRDQLVVVSGFGQFALRNDDAVGRAMESAVVRKPDRAGSEPRGYLVRKSGEVVGLDVAKVARTLERLRLAQVSTPAVDAPARRLMPFNPVRRALTPAREERALRQDPRMSRPFAAPSAPPLADRTPTPLADRTPTPERQEPALLILMPDGSLARPSIGAASRWQQMLGGHARSSQRQFAVDTGSVVAVISGPQVGTAGERALARSEALAAVRSETAPVRTLGDDRLAQAFADGAKLVPAMAAGDRFWVQPGPAVQPERQQRPVAAEPLQLGQITGDPWADWALAMGGARLRQLAQSAAQPAPDQGRPAPLQLAGAQVVAFRAPDGNIVLNGDAAPIRLAALDRQEMPLAVRRQAELAPRSGAVPAAALQALQISLERTAAAGGYRLPVARLESAPDAINMGRAMLLDPMDERRTSASLAGPTTLAGRTAQLVLSMPFPNASEIHVGSDLSDALHAYLAAPVVPVLPSTADSAPLTSARDLPGQVAFRIRPLVSSGAPVGLFAGTSPSPEAALDLPDTHLRAQRAAQDAIVTFEVPAVRPLLRGDLSASGLPLLLRRAVAEGGDWTPGPGAPLPLAVQDLTGHAPFDLPPMELAAPAPARPAAPGVEEIVVPLPLWAQMGRGALSETRQIMASPLSPAGHAPPLGMYRLVVPGGGRLDLTAGAPTHWPGNVDLTGPTSLRLDRGPAGAVSARTGGGGYLLGRVPVDDGRRRSVAAPIRDAVVPQVLVDTPAMPAAPMPAISTAGLGEQLPVPPPALQSSLVRPPLGSPATLPPRPALTSSLPLAPPATFAGISPQSGAGPSPRLSASGLRIPAPPPGRAALPPPISSPAITANARTSLSVPAQRPTALSRGEIPAFATPVRFAPVAAPAGLSPGMWSGHRPHESPAYQRWVYTPTYRDQSQAFGTVRVSGFSRVGYPQLPSALRFRYVSAPLWWTGSTAKQEADDSGAQAASALRSGLRAANSAAAIWRSIFVAGAPQDDVTGGMDAGREESAQSMSSVARAFDPRSLALATPAPVATVPAAAPAYIAMTSSGAAGAVTGTAAARSRAQAVEMSIVAAIPPAPPPLESMSSAPRGSDAPHARGRAAGGQGAHAHHKEAEDAVSHSKIEGSVDAIAQRIYHRIRQRIQSDRERFGG